MKKIVAFISLVLSLSFLASVCSFADALIVDPSPIEYGYQDTDFWVVVSAPDDYVNHRTGPGLTYDPPIQRVYNGTELHIIATCENSRDGQTWGKCDYNGSIGWVSTNQCTVVQHQTEPETTTTAETPAPTTQEAATTTSVTETTVVETSTFSRETRETLETPSNREQKNSVKTTGFSLVIIVIILSVVVVALIALVILLLIFSKKRK